ncbi:MAG: methyl-accepting chemotaxis protein [Proteobacteria bacterium]|nr:methyl-accepting chemotaxis protein [Pseudomonadota bacterium]MCL2307693.1 methyl-accepting chemotaxis protein [Pseudomonadota bacterium]
MAIENPLVKKVSIPVILARGTVLLFMVLLALAIVGFMQYREITQASHRGAVVSEAGEALIIMTNDLEQLTARNGGQALTRLRQNAQKVENVLATLATDERTRFQILKPKSAPAIDRLLKQLQGEWQPTERNLSTLQSQRDLVDRLSVAYAALTGAGDEAPFAQARAVGQQVLRDGETVALAELAAQLEGTVQRLSRYSDALLTGSSVNETVLAKLSEDTLYYRSLTTRLLREPGLRTQSSRLKLGEFLTAAEPFEMALDTVLSDVNGFAEFLSVKERTRAQAAKTGQTAVELSHVYSTQGFSQTAIVAFSFLALAALIILMYLGRVVVRETRAQIRSSEQENVRNQEAILLLLDETSQMAEGDLTTRATVSEAITGAIADALNFTLDEMSSVIRGINQAADQVTQETEKAQKISEQLYVASQHQSQEIRRTANTVLKVTQSISEVAQSATQSAQVAQQSLEAAGKGGEAVRSQIGSMSDIRTQIQETAKRIKRLGESSLEIGEIVGLISDITEQTNVLALNAAIQAAAAGEAGRGFAVVAEEVQRLAERSGEATKQIEAIVKTIQADTQDAVSAMERSTSGVVEGTRLSEEAGQALAEIERVSNTLAKLIQGISQQTQAQATSVEEVRAGIAGILTTTEDTTQGTEQTTISIGQLAQVAAELRAAVSGFKID